MDKPDHRRSSASDKPESDHAFSERLRQLRAALSNTQPQMDAALGIGKRSWQRYESGSVSPGSQVIAGLIDLGFSANWILRGYGPMRIKEVSTRPLVEGQYYAQVPESQSVKEPNDHYQLPSSGVASIGFDRRWLKSIDTEPDAIVQFLMPDDAMAPQIKPGAVLFADRNKRQVDGPGIWAVRTNQVISAARVQPSSGEKLLVSHDNSLYRDVVLEAENDLIQIVGKVIWHGGPIL
ncbi:MAG: LexA family transcriptional regulator [Pseudomonadota bacterium]